VTRMTNTELELVLLGGQRVCILGSSRTRSEQVVGLIRLLVGIDRTTYSASGQLFECTRHA
jgi:hypothetical protein